MARPFFKIKVTRARVTISGLRAADMKEIGQAFVTSMKQRWDRAEDINDRPAPPLTEKYKIRKMKSARYPSMIRDLRYSNDLRYGARVIKVDQNSATIYFTAWQMIQRMTFNQRRSPMWGVSPRDAEAIRQAVDDKLRVKVEHQQALTA